MAIAGLFFAPGATPGPFMVPKWAVACTGRKRGPLGWRSTGAAASTAGNRASLSGVRRANLWRAVHWTTPNSSSGPARRCVAYGELVPRHQDVAVRTAYLVCGDADEAEDATQEAS